MKLIDIILVILVFIIIFLVYKKRNINKISEELDIKEDFYATIDSTIVNSHYKLIESIRNISTTALNILQNRDIFTIPAKTINVKNLTIDGKILLNNDSSMLHLLPKNIVIAFAGDNIPKGWVLCDGKTYSLDDNGNVKEDSLGTETPDLRGRFILGAGTGIDIDGITNLTKRKWKDKDGEENHTLTIPEMPEHNHFVNVWSPGEMDSKYLYYHNDTVIYVDEANILVPSIYAKTIDYQLNWRLDNIILDRPYLMNRVFTDYWTVRLLDVNKEKFPLEMTPAGGILNKGTGYIKGGANADYGHPEYTTQPHNNMPPFYVLTYIMKI